MCFCIFFVVALFCVFFSVNVKPLAVAFKRGPVTADHFSPMLGDIPLGSLGEAKISNCGRTQMGELSASNVGCGWIGGAGTIP